MLNPKSYRIQHYTLVGTAGIEPVTSRMWTVRSDQLSYAPLRVCAGCVYLDKNTTFICTLIKNGSCIIAEKRMLVNTNFCFFTRRPNYVSLFTFRYSSVWYPPLKVTIIFSFPQRLEYIQLAYGRISLYSVKHPEYSFHDFRLIGNHDRIGAYAFTLWLCHNAKKSNQHFIFCLQKSRLCSSK